MGFLSGLLGGGQQTNTTTNTPTLTPAQQAAQAQVTTAANNAFTNTAIVNASQGYAGATPVGPSAATTTGQQQLIGATPTMQQMAGQTAGATQFGLSDALNIADNKYVQNLKDTSNQQTINNFAGPNGALANIRSGAVSNGAYGGSRQGIAEGTALTGLAQALATSNAQTDATAYGQGLNTFNQTLNSMPATMSTQLLPGQTTAAVGANQEGYQQNQAAYDAAVRNFNANGQWQNVNNLANVIYPTITPGSTTSQTGASSTGGLQNIGTIMQLASTGMSMYNT